MQLNQNALWYIVSLKLNKYLQIIISFTDVEKQSRPLRR